jgi:hypothetical protein
MKDIIKLMWYIVWQMNWLYSIYNDLHMHKNLSNPDDMDDIIMYVLANAWEEGDEVVLVSCRMQRTNITIWKEYFSPTNDMEL